jgi:small nuclear ribonucleoprotein (snRNP)-like protein
MPRARKRSPGSSVLSCLDGYMNIALEQTEGHVNGVVTNRYGDAFVRGNNGPMMALSRFIAS